MWADVVQPNTKFEPAWQIDVCHLNDEDIGKITEDGLGGKLRHDDEKGTFITIKQKVDGKDGKKFDPPEVVDAQRRPFTQKIGNGSKVNVRYKRREWDYGSKSGISGDLRGVQVVEYVAIPGGDEDSFEVIGSDEGGEDSFGDLEA